MQHFLGVPAFILVAILGSLCCLLLAIGFCKATQLLRTPVLPDVIPRVGSQSCPDLEIVVDPGSPAPSDKMGWQKLFD